MMFSLRVVVAVAAALLVSIPAATAFVPSSAVSSSRTLVSSFELNALNRRDAVGVALAGLFSLNVLPADATNPALETFKGGKKTKGSFIPGKGIRQHEDDLLMASNPGTLLCCVFVYVYHMHATISYFKTTHPFGPGLLYRMENSTRNVQGPEKNKWILHSWKRHSSTRGRNADRYQPGSGNLQGWQKD
jgi:hypothetical protein